jgi:hypothetical protein
MVRATRIMALVCLWLTPLLILSTALASDWVSVWQEFHLPVHWGPFMDLAIISSGVKTQQMGGDPLVSNFADRYQRQIPYPRIWVYLFSWLRITNSRVATVGVVFCVLYLICISWLILRCPVVLGPLILLIAGLSLAPLLAIERGNIDLFIFFLIFLGCAATNRFLRIGAFFAATALKIYPVAALMVEVIRRPLKSAAAPIAGTLSAAALLAWQWRDLEIIRRTAPRMTFLSFGTLTLVEQAKYLRWQFIACSCLAAAIIAGIAWRSRPKIDQDILNSKLGEMFLIFGGLYVFAFAIGANFNYRLIFLIPTLPLVLELTRRTSHRKWGVIYIASVLAAENSFFLGVYQGIPLGDLSTFVVFAMILPILLQQARSFLLSASLAFQSPTNLAASDDKVG